MANRFSRPAPKWYRKAKDIWVVLENSALIILLMYYPADSKTLLIAKVVSSTIKQLLDLVLVSESEGYASKEVIEAGESIVGGRPDDRNKPTNP